jgi:DNA repair protein RadA/Sms
VFIGEVGLGGEVRAVAQTERRLAEAAKMGMTNAFVAQRSADGRIPKGVRATGVATVGEMFRRLFS